MSFGGNVNSKTKSILGCPWKLLTKYHGHPSTPPKFNSLPLKNGWKTPFPLGFGNFSGAVPVKLQGGTPRFQKPPDRIGLFGFQSHPKRIGFHRENSSLSNRTYLDSYPWRIHGTTVYYLPTIWSHQKSIIHLGKYTNGSSRYVKFLPKLVFFFVFTGTNMTHKRKIQVYIKVPWIRHTVDGSEIPFPTTWDVKKPDK